MRIAIIGRTKLLLETARRAIACGHEIPVVWTGPAEEFYDAKEADFEKFSNEIGAAFINNTRINQPENVKLLASFDCASALSVNWQFMLSAELLNTFPMGVLNAHAGDLPRYRGNACPNWAIIAGESHVGLCIHKMVSELDAGPVFLRDRLPLDHETYIGDVYAWLESRIPTMFVEVISRLESGSITAEPQPDDPQLVLRTYPRRPEDGRINWASAASVVHRLIRASSRPFSGAYTSLEGQRRVTIWRAELQANSGGILAVPGQVCFRKDSDPVVACADGLIRLTEVEVDGCSGDKESKVAIARSLRSRLI